MKLKRQTDLLLLHPPSVYDFRERLIIPSPMADLVPSGPFFEMFPIGFSFLGEYLERHGMKVRVVNLAARMLEQPGFDVERFISRQRPRAFGIGLHWMPHCHGAVEVARLCKRLHPGVPVIMGGYSASIFHRELMQYPEIDFVVRGDSGEEPLLRLMEALEAGASPSAVPNVTYRDPATAETVANPLGYVPEDLDHLGSNYLYMMRSAARYADLRGVRAFRGWWSYPVTAVLTCKGCTNNCTFCGGSAWAMSSCFARRGVAVRSPEAVARDVEMISEITGAPIFVIGDILQPGDDYARELLGLLGRISPRNHIVLELFKPAPRWFFRDAGSHLPSFDLEISPESHDETVRLAAGKRYTNVEMEENIAWALQSGCGKVDVFFMVGLEGQTRASVMDTVEYCAGLLDRHGTRVNPLIGPLAPFLDPGSLNHADAESHGYRVLLNSFEEYRSALLEPHWRDLLGYETKWMSRQEIVDATYEALLELNRVKRSRGQVTVTYARAMERFLEDNVALLDRLDRSALLEDPGLRAVELEAIKVEADALLERSWMVKKELEWPVEGSAFNYARIARIALRGWRVA